MKIYTFFLVLTVLVGTVQAAGKRKNFFERGMNERIGSLTAIFDPAIRALEICKQNLDENPALSDFKSNFDLINCAYQKVYANIVSDQELLSEFIALHSSDEIKGKIEIIKKLFAAFYLLITHNNPSCSLIDDVEQEQKELLLTIKKFLDYKRFHDALAQGNMETLESFFEHKQEAFDVVEIAIEPDATDDEKCAQQLQLELNLELMHEREAQERSVLDEHQINDNLVETIEVGDSFSNEEIMSECPSVRQRRISIFSGATNDAQFIAQLKRIIYRVDIAKSLDQGLFDRLTAHAPTNFSMLMNREIGRATSYDVMQHNFCMPPYAHYFPECLRLEVEPRVITLKGHTGAIYCIKQLDDGRLVSCSGDGMIKVWDLNRNKCVATFQQGNDEIVHIEELGDGLLAFYSDYYGETVWVWVWDFNSYRCVATYHQQLFFSSGVITLTLNDGHRVSGAFDSKVRIFPSSDAECIGSCEHEGSVRCIQQLSDGRIASCSDDETIKLWDLYPDLSFEQIALVVHLERCRQKGQVVNLGGGWHEVFETLPDYFKKRFE
jgi:hypothetical protein